MIAVRIDLPLSKILRIEGFKGDIRVLKGLLSDDDRYRVAYPEHFKTLVIIGIRLRLHGNAIPVPVHLRFIRGYGGYLYDWLDDTHNALTLREYEESKVKDLNLRDWIQVVLNDSQYRYYDDLGIFK